MFAQLNFLRLTSSEISRSVSTIYWFLINGPFGFGQKDTFIGPLRTPWHWRRKVPVKAIKCLPFQWPVFPCIDFKCTELVENRGRTYCMLRTLWGWFLHKDPFLGVCGLWYYPPIFGLAQVCHRKTRVLKRVCQLHLFVFLFLKFKIIFFEVRKTA